jgi:hypothetical protein
LGILFLIGNQFKNNLAISKTIPTNMKLSQLQFVAETGMKQRYKLIVKEMYEIRIR